MNVCNRKSEAGFSIIEVLVVLVVLSILAAIAIPNFLKARDRVKQRVAQAEVRSIATGVSDYKIDTEMYPLRVDLGASDLEILENMFSPVWLNMKMQPYDPWERPYHYQCDDGSSYTIKSFGKDGLPSPWSSFDDRFNFELDIGIVDGETVGSADV